MLFLAVYFGFQLNTVTCISLLLFISAMIPVYFIDMATFTIPDELNIFALVVASGRDIYGIVTHETGHELLWGWLPRSIFGAIVGTLIFGVVRILGWVWKRQEAMGLGDPLLARAMGAMLISVTPVGMNPLRLFPIWVFASCMSGVVIGIALISMRTRFQKPEVQTADIISDAVMLPESSFKEQVLEIGYCLILGDLIDIVNDFIHPARRNNRIESLQEIEEPFTPAPSAIPFGPFLVIGFLAALFFGEMLTAAYLNYALPKPMP